MWIPNKDAEDGLLPVAIWNRIYPALLQDGCTVVSAPLVQFLQYQMLGTAQVNEVLYTNQDLLQPQVTAEFLRHQASVLLHLGTPSVNTTADATGPDTTGATGGAFGMNAAQFQAFIAALQTGHTTAGPATSSTLSANTIGKRWSINLTSLLKLVQVSNV